ncbi:MAG: cellulose biosynthesis protein CelD [Rhodopirellula sp.]|nr:cellulose biosynthesis protein CelD [Rhodopirellula sp.]
MLAEKIFVEIKTVTFSQSNIEALEERWQRLYAHSDACFFLSWRWIGNWLTTYKPELLILEAVRSDHLIGLGLLSMTEERRHGFVVSNCMRLHQTGQPYEDQIWIEYNDFLIKRGEEQAVSKAFLDALKRNEVQWDELIVSGMDVGRASELSRDSGMHALIRWQTPCVGVDLDGVRSSASSFLQALSSNARYQIKRSIRLYSEFGDLAVHRPVSVSEAIDWFDGFGEQHINRWGRLPGQSGYANREFVRFHHGLIRAGWEKGEVDIAVVKAGDELLAGFYNFIQGKRVYFYLGVTIETDDNRLKPGLVGHSMMIQEYLDKGLDFYDFMGGEDRYKKSLGREHGSIVKMVLQRPRVILYVENALRSARNLLSRGVQ